jgi:hypothetical protein
MTPEQKASYINAQVALFNAEIEGMKAENIHRLNCDNSIAYAMDEFYGVIKKWESILGSNALIEFFKE